MSSLSLSKAEVDALILKKLSEHQFGISLDKEYFLDLLKHSLSLGVADKQRVIDAIPTLTQYQFDELIKVFLEEREKFRDLAKENSDDIKKLLEKQQREWLEIGEMYFISEKNLQKQQEDQAKIDDLKASLGL